MARYKIIFFNPYLTQADLYIYHMWDDNTPVYEILKGLSNVVKAGKAGYIGISNCYAWQLAKAVDLKFTEQGLAYLEEPYTPHRLVGVMAQNTEATRTEKKIWTTSQKQKKVERNHG